MDYFASQVIIYIMMSININQSKGLTRLGVDKVKPRAWFRSALEIYYVLPPTHCPPDIFPSQALSCQVSSLSFILRDKN